MQLHSAIHTEQEGETNEKETKEGNGKEGEGEEGNKEKLYFRIHLTCGQSAFI